MISVLYTKVVNYQCEFELIFAVLPKYVHEFYRRIAVAVEVLEKLLVGKETGLWEAVHALPDLGGKFYIACDGT